MTIEQLGSIGELVGAVATVATLAYLAAQIRQSSRATETASYIAVSAGMGDFVRMCAEDPDLADLYSRACESYTDLSRAERARAHMVFSTMLFPNSLMLQLEQAGLVDPSASETVTIQSFKLVFAMAGVRQWWELESRWFPAKLQAHVAAVLAGIDRDGTILIPPAAEPTMSRHSA